MAPAPKRALRPRLANGLAKTTIRVEGHSKTATASTKPTKPAKPKAAAVKKEPKKAAAPTQTTKSKPTGVKKQTEKAAAPATKPASKSKAPPKVKPGNPNKRVVKWELDRRVQANKEHLERKQWFVWPPWPHVSQIPKEHVQRYKDMIGSKHPWLSDAGEHCPSLPNTNPPSLYDDSNLPNAAITVLAYRAKYKVVFQCPNTGKCRAVCVEPGWESAHSKNEDVWFEPHRIPGWKGGKPKEVLLGFPERNGELSGLDSSAQNSS